MDRRVSGVDRRMSRMDRRTKGVGRRYTLADVRASYTPEKAWAEMQGDLLCYLVYRKLSFYVTPPLLRLGVPIMAVTLGSLAIALGMAAVAARGGERAWLAVAALGFLYHVLDCVDGNMARTTGRTSRLGAIVDGTCDMAFWCLLLLSLGLLVAGQGGGLFGAHAREFSLALCVLLLLNRQTRDNFAVQNAVPSYFRAVRPARIPPAQWLLMAVTGLEFGYVFAIAAGGAFGVLDWVLAGTGVYVAAIFVGALALTVRQAAALDRSGPAEPGPARPSAERDAATSASDPR